MGFNKWYIPETTKSTKFAIFWYHKRKSVIVVASGRGKVGKKISLLRDSYVTIRHVHFFQTGFP